MKSGEISTITANGIPIYAYPNPALHGFCLAIYVRAGSMYETEENNGIAHFLEHIVFRNIHARMHETLYRTLDRLGLNFNAFTYKELIQFRITGAGKHFREAADILAQVLVPLKLPAGEISVERNRIKAEIREDDEEQWLSCFADREVWNGTSLSLTVPGRIGRLNRIGYTALSEEHMRLFCRGNLFAYVTGCAGEEDILYFARCLESYSIPAAACVRSAVAPVPPDFLHRGCRIAVRQKTTAEVFFGFDLDMTKYSRAAVMLLYDILVAGESSRLYQNLSERTGLIYSYDSVLEHYDNIGSLKFSFEVRGGRMIEAVERVLTLLAELREGIGDALTYVRPSYTDNAYLTMDDAETFNFDCAYRWHILHPCTEPDLDALIKMYASVTSEEIETLARALFVPDHTVIALYGDKKKLDTEAIHRMVSEKLGGIKEQ